MVNLTLSAKDAFFSLHSYLKHLPCPHTILSVMSLSSWCVFSAFLVCIHCTQTSLASISTGSAHFHPHASVFTILTSPFVSLCVESVCFHSHACSFAIPTPAFVSSSLDSACICPPSFVFAVLRPPFVSSSLVSACF